MEEEQTSLEHRMEKMKENIKFLISANRAEQEEKMSKVEDQFKKKISEGVEEIQSIRLNLASKMI